MVSKKKNEMEKKKVSKEAFYMFQERTALNFLASTMKSCIKKMFKLSNVLSHKKYNFFVLDQTSGFNNYPNPSNFSLVQLLQRNSLFILSLVSIVEHL